METQFSTQAKRDKKTLSIQCPSQTPNPSSNPPTPTFHKKRWIVFLSLSLCFLLATTFGLRYAFTNKVEPLAVESKQSIEQVQQNSIYREIKITMQNDFEQLKSNILADNQVNTILQKFETEYLQPLYDLLDHNAEIQVIDAFITNFVQDPINQELVLQLQNLSKDNFTIGLLRAIGVAEVVALLIAAVTLLADGAYQVGIYAYQEGGFRTNWWNKPALVLALNGALGVVVGNIMYINFINGYNSVAK